MAATRASIKMHHRIRLMPWSRFLQRSTIPLSTSCRFSSTATKSQSPDEASDVISLTVNGDVVEGHAGQSVLDVCHDNGIAVPHLCYHPRLPAAGNCRLCLVQVDDDKHLRPSCRTEARSGMKIETHTPEIRQQVKDTLKLYRGSHCGDCMTCAVNGRCELQDLCYRYDVEDVGPKYARPFEANWSDGQIQYDPYKCILCRRCVRACEDIQGMGILGMAGRGAESHITTFGDQPINSTECLQCGQCVEYCPVGALTETDHVHAVVDLLDNKDVHKRILCAQTAPSIRVAIGEAFNMKPGAVTTGQMVSALRELGFDYVFDTNFTADLTIVEESTEFLSRFTEGTGPMPMFTSCCPAWINMVEKIYPELIPHVSTCRSPQGMLSSLVKTFVAERLGVTPGEMAVVSIMPCVAKKDEAARTALSSAGRPDTDFVLTTREFANLLEMKRIPFASLPESKANRLLGESSGAADIFGVTGGVMEAALRTAYEKVTGETLPKLEFAAVRGFNGVKSATIHIKDIPVRVAVAHAGANIRKFIESGDWKNYDFIEMMTCAGGCIGGAGQPKNLDPHVLQERMRAIYSIDEAKTLRKSHENEQVKQLYEEYLGEPNSHIAHETLHTHYTDRSDGKR